MAHESLEKKLLKHGIFGYPNTFDVTFMVALEPRGKGRVRVGRARGSKTIKTATAAFVMDTGGGKVHTYKDKKTLSWEKAFNLVANGFAPKRGILQGTPRVDILALFPRPAYMDKGKKPKWPAGFIRKPSKPDKDNVEKLVLDAMSKSGLWWRDDCQIAEGETRTYFHERGGKPRVYVRVREVFGDPDVSIWSSALTD